DLGDDIANLKPSFCGRRVRHNGGHAESGALHSDRLETGASLACPHAEGPRTLEPEFTAPVVESDYKLSEDLVSDAAVDVGEREPFLFDRGVSRRGPVDPALGDIK